MYKKNKLGVISKEPEDPRDYLIAEIQKPVKLPGSFMLQNKMTSIESQNWGSCTANATDGVKEYLDTKEYHKKIKLSQKFIYNVMKQRVSNLKSIQGDWVKNALKTVCKYGACLEKTFPDKRRISWKKYVADIPSEKAFREAEKYKGKTYWRVGRTLEEFRQAVYQQKAPVVFSMMWYSSYNNPGEDGKLPLPNKKAGGHALVAIGWENNKLWVRNSWGRRYGEDGYFYIPFNEFEKHDIWDNWILIDILKPKPKTKIGWLADSWLKSAFTEGETAWNTYALNFRTEPWGRKIKTLPKNTKVKILGESKKTSDGLNWQKIELKGRKPKTKNYESNKKTTLRNSFKTNMLKVN